MQSSAKRIPSLYLRGRQDLPAALFCAETQSSDHSPIAWSGAKNIWPDVSFGNTHSRCGKKVSSCMGIWWTWKCWLRGQMHLSTSAWGHRVRCSLDFMAFNSVRCAVSVCCPSVVIDAFCSQKMVNWDRVRVLAIGWTSGFGPLLLIIMAIAPMILPTL